ncbi:hypothetical protein GCM10010336_74470 [Streptomyces goshikiensis]|nr:hypothetical protein GCM10010336_74470 [Streptomyces goshikiensis]
MITLARGAAALALALLPLSLPTTAHAAPSAPEILPIGVAVTELPVATESRTGYQRDAFKHWTSGDNPSDGCSTRNEVLLAEAVIAPTVGPRCALTGGAWFSYYDERAINAAGSLDIDHMVPLAEAWDSK